MPTLERTLISSLVACVLLTLGHLASPVLAEPYRFEIPGPGIVDLELQNGVVLALESGGAFDPNPSDPSPAAVLLTASPASQRWAFLEAGSWEARAAADPLGATPTIGHRFRAAEVTFEDLFVTVDPGLVLRGHRTTWHLAEVVASKEENHEVDPDPLRLEPRGASIVSVLDLVGEDPRGASLPPVRIVLTGVASAVLASKEENHEVDPDPLRAAWLAGRWQARIDRPGRSLGLSFAASVSPSAPGWTDAWLAWIAAWLWPEAYATEPVRPHDCRFALRTFGPFRPQRARAVRSKKN